MKLKAGKALQEHREMLLERQGMADPIADIIILDPVLDHDHDTGFCRACLDRRTNAWEGKVKNSFKRCGLHGLGVSYPDAIRRLADYVEADWSDQPVHPKHRTPDEKRLARNRRARRARKK